MGNLQYFRLNIFHPIWCLPRWRSTVTYKIRLYFDYCLVFFDLDILSLIKKKTISLFPSVSLWFFSLSLISKIYHAWFLKWWFWFSKWDRYGSSQRDSFGSGWSAILKARTLTHRSWPNVTERVFSEEAASTTIRAKTEVFISTEGLQNIALHCPKAHLNLKKNILRGHSKKVCVKFCRRGLQTQTLLKKRPYIRTLIRFVSYTELSNFSNYNVLEFGFFW